MVDILANALTQIKNAEKVAKASCVIKPVSNLLRDVLTLLKEEGYIGDFETIDDGKGGIINVNLLGRINECGAIRPRFSVSKNEFEKFEKRYLPSKNYGIIIVSTNQGIITNEKAKKMNIGGTLLAFVY